MTTLFSLLLVAIFTLDYFAIKLAVINKLFTLIPEIFSALIVLIAVGRAVVLRKWEQPTRYVWFVVAFVLVCMIGAVAEAEAPGPLVAGMRNYFKYFPLLLLPAVYDFSEKQLKTILIVFASLAAIQVPLAYFQRFVQFSDMMHTGDPITGTVTVSSALTMVMCLAIALVMTLYVHGKIKLPLTLLLFCFFAAPTAINETKGTIFLLPVATVGPFLFARGVERKWRKAVPVLAVCVIGLVAFVTIYNTLITSRWGGTNIIDFFSTAKYETYLYRGSDESDLVRSIGRVDSIILPIKVLSENWIQLMFGLGIGNVSPSSLPGMEGAYAETGRDLGYGMTAIGNLIWETGLVGLVLYLLFFVLVWRDTRRCAALDNNPGWYCTWWTPCIIIFVFGLVYKSVLQFNELGYIVFFWSGVIASRYWRLRHSRGGKLSNIDPTRPRLQLAGI